MALSHDSYQGLGTSLKHPDRYEKRCRCRQGRMLVGSKKEEVYKIKNSESNQNVFLPNAENVALFALKETKRT